MSRDVELGIRLRADGSGLIGAAQRSRQAVDGLSQSTRQAGQSARVAGQDVNRLSQNTQRTGQSARTASQNVNRLSQNTQRTGQSARTASQDMNRLSQSTQRAGRSARSAGDGFNGLQSALAGLGLAVAVRELLQAQLRTDVLEISFKAITGSAEKAAEELSYLRQESERLGLNFVVTAEAYKGLIAASKGTVLEGKATREIFTAVSEASTVLQLSAEKSGRVLYALTQMISKGNVSAEELRQQMGESLPGAFQLAARAMGKSTRELNKMLDRGELLATDLLPRLAAELRKTYGSGVQDSVKSLNAEINRLSNSFERLKVSMADAGIFSTVIGWLKAVVEFTQKAFHVIQIMRVAAFGGIESAVRHLKYNFSVATEFIGITWESLLNGFRNVQIGLWEGVAKGFDLVKMKDKAAEVRLFIEAMSDIKTATPNVSVFFDSVNKLADEMELDKAIILEQEQHLVRLELAAMSAAESISKLASAGKEIPVTTFTHYPPVALPETETSIKARAKKHAQAIKSIKDAQISLLPFYDQAVAKAGQWRDKILAGLDHTKAGYKGLAKEVEDVYGKQIATAYKEDLKRQRNHREEQLRESRIWSDGIKRAVQDYVSEAINSAKQWENVTKRVLGSMDDAFTRFFTGQKMGAKEMVESVLSDLIRLQVQQSITQPLSSAIGSALGSVAGGMFGASSAPSMDAAGPSAGVFGSVFHGGGVVGEGSNSVRVVPSGLFVNAPRFHSGGIVGDEVPIIAKRGEEVLTVEESLARRRGGSEQKTVQISIENRGRPAEVRDAQASFDPTRMFISVFIDDLTSGGPVSRSIGSTFGLARAAG